MTTLMQTVFGLTMIAIGSLKTWLHMGSVTVLSLPMCSGKTVTLSASHQSWFEQAHCWGCYLFAAGLVVAAVAAFNAHAQRRSVTADMD